MYEYIFGVYLEGQQNKGGVSSWGSISNYILACYAQKETAQHFIYCIFTIRSEIKNIRPMTNKSMKMIEKKSCVFSTH